MMYEGMMGQARAIHWLTGQEVTNMSMLTALKSSIKKLPIIHKLVSERDQLYAQRNQLCAERDQ